MKGRSALDPCWNPVTAWAKSLPLRLLIPAAIWALMMIGAVLLDKSELGAAFAFLYLHLLLSSDPSYHVCPGGIADLYLRRKGKGTMALEVAGCSGPWNGSWNSPFASGRLFRLRPGHLSP